jgi:hypothetical protein
MRLADANEEGEKDTLEKVELLPKIYISISESISPIVRIAEEN